LKLERRSGFERKISLNIGKKEAEFFVNSGEILSFATPIFELKMGVVLCEGFLGTPDIELKMQVSIFKTTKN